MTATSIAPQGFAAIFHHALMPLNEKPCFMKRFGGIKRQYLVDSPFWKNAVRIRISAGRITVDSAGKDLKGDFMQEISGSHVYINMPLNLLLTFANRQVSILTLAKNWFQGKVIIRGYLYIFELYKLFACYKQK